LLNSAWDINPNKKIRIVKDSKDFSDSKNNSPYINPVIDLLCISFNL